MATTSMIIDSPVRIIRMGNFRFSFSSSEAIPSVIMGLDIKVTPTWHQKKYDSHELLVPLTRNCSLEGLDMGKSDFELVDAVLKIAGSMNQFYVVNFWFARRAFAIPSDQFKEKRVSIEAAFREICDKSLWQVAIYSNPFFENGVEVKGQRSVSINMDARQPRFDDEGNPVLRWKRDEKRRKIGDRPVPIQPEHQFRFDEANNVRLFSV